MPPKVKKVIKYTLIGIFSLFLLLILGLLTYYLFFFKNSRDISHFVPSDADFYLSFEDFNNIIEQADQLYTDEAKSVLLPFKKKEDLEEIREKTGWLSWIIDDEVAVFRRDTGFGFAARITFPAKLILSVPGFLSSNGIRSEQFKGNSLSAITINERVYYFTHKWNIICGASDSLIAGDVAELLNKRPVIKPLAFNPRFKGIRSDADSGNLIYGKNAFNIPNTVLTEEFTKITGFGGDFSVTDQGISGSLNIGAENLSSFKPPLFPENATALSVMSLPCNLKEFWLDYSRNVQNSKDNVSSLQIGLTSEMFEPLFDTLEPRIFLYHFVKDRKNPLSTPSAVFCFRGNRAFSQKTLEIIWEGYVNSIRKNNEEKVDKRGAQPLEIKNLKKNAGDITVNYMTVTPSLIPGFSPGFCVVDNILVVGTDSDFLVHTAYKLKSGKNTITHPYYFRTDDSGFSNTLSFLEKMNGSPSRIKRLGTVRHSQIVQAIETMKALLSPVRKLTLNDSGKPVLDRIEFKIDFIKAEDGQQTENKE